MDTKRLNTKAFSILRRSVAIELLSNLNDVRPGFILKGTIDSLWVTSLETVQTSQAIVCYFQEIMRIVVFPCRQGAFSCWK